MSVNGYPPHQRCKKKPIPEYLCAANARHASHAVAEGQYIYVLPMLDMLAMQWQKVSISMCCQC